MARKVERNYNFLSHYTYYVPGVAEMFILLAWLLAGALVGNLIAGLFLLFMDASAATTYGTLVAYPLMFIPAMMYASAKSRARCLNYPGVLLDSNHFAPVQGWLCALLAMAGTLALSFMSDAVASVLPPMPEWLESALSGLTQGNVLINFLMVSIFAPLFEEWLCRGQVLRGLLNNGIKPLWAIVISAVFFAVIHANPWQAIPAFLLGCLFGYVYYRTGSLKLTMLMHFTNNTFALICGHIDALQDVENWQEFLSPQAYWIIFAACAVLLALIVRQFRRIPLQSPKGNCDPAAPLFSE